jgi:hypothetical protein
LVLLKQSGILKMDATVNTYEEWLIEVREALTSINMSLDDWQSIWPVDFRLEFDNGTAANDAAEWANRFWWLQQNRSLKRDCLQTQRCWLQRGHEGACQPISEIH